MTGPGALGWTRRHAVAIGVASGAVLLGAEIVLGRHVLAAAASAITGARPGWVLLAVVATTISMQCFARTQRRMLGAADPRLKPVVTVRRMVALVYSANALSATLPAGGAVSVAFMVKRIRGWGSTSAAAGFTVLASGLLSSTTFFAMVAVWGLGVATAAIVVGTVLAAVLAVRAWLATRMRRAAGIDRLSRLAGGVERGLARVSGRWASGWVAAVDDLRRVRPRRSDWLAGTGLAGGNWMADFGCLVACCAAVGVPVEGLVVLLAAYLAGMSASSVAVLPGGFGVIEVAMVGVLHGGGVAVDAAVAAVLLYRTISCLLVVAVGWALLSRDAWLAARPAPPHHAERPVALQHAA